MNQISKQLRYFIYSMGYIVRDIITKGTFMAERDTIIERRNICNKCELLDKNFCKECGCYIPLKTQLFAIICPINKWSLNKRRK